VLQHCATETETATFISRVMFVLTFLDWIGLDFIFDKKVVAPDQNLLYIFLGFCLDAFLKLELCKIVSLLFPCFVFLKNLTMKTS
jgi:hypothetical protein